ncbi:hypothetical protein [Paraflavitalea sp. CAU 1676]|uniref:hypothetical protein n=1 Tax=Paraflavitalea sp. CAU 1676 TaxID=3032598 RepID=UPI0023DC4FD7|nr:hypothetical protein [Paraflavitalea sp. CAU 1676]MDF2192846.1 hypothetical protein [Paraflavitalea sp. CAU 1676]
MQPRHYLAAALTAAILYGCKKENKDNNQEPDIPATGNYLNAKATVLDTMLITQVTAESVSINRTTGSVTPKAGDILVAPATIANPDGVLRKVVSVVVSANQYACTTEQAGLNEAFRQLDINSVYENDFTANSTVAKGVSLGFNFSTEGTSIPGVKITGTLKLNIPSVKLEYVKKDGSLMPEKVLIQADLNTDGSALEITNKSPNSIKLLEEVTLKEIPLPVIRLTIPVTTPLGIFPLPVPLHQKVILKWLPVTISNKAAFKISPKINVVFGAQYGKNGWQNISTFSSNISADSLLQDNFNTLLDMNASFTLFKPVYQIAPYNSDVLKAAVEIPNELEFDFTPNRTPQYALKFSTSVTGKVSSQLWLGEHNEFTLSVPLIDKTIKEGSWLPRPDTLYIVAGNNQMGKTGQYVSPLSVEVKDVAGRLYPGAKVEWTVTGGGGALDSALTHTRSDGYSFNKWKLGSGTPQQVQVSVKKADGSHVKGSPVIFKASLDSVEIYKQSMLGQWLKSPADPAGSTTYCHMQADGKGYYTVFNNPSWTDGTKFGMTWNIVYQNGRYYYWESGFWHPGFPSIEAGYPLTYPVSSFNFHNNTVYTKQ